MGCHGHDRHTAHNFRIVQGNLECTLCRITQEGVDGSVVIASKPGLLSQHWLISSAVTGSIPAENHQGVLVGIACQPSPTVLMCVLNVKGSTWKSP